MEHPESPAATAITEAAARITEILPPLALDNCVGRLGALIAELDTPTVTISG
jgi:hypothetical protein